MQMSDHGVANSRALPGFTYQRWDQVRAPDLPIRSGLDDRRPASASYRKPMICSSERRFFTSNLLLVGIGLQIGLLLKIGGRRCLANPPNAKERS